MHPVPINSMWAPSVPVQALYRLGAEPRRAGCPVPPTRPPYPPEFRPEAVRLVRSSGKALKETAADLGVSTESLRKWVRLAEIDAGEREGLATAEREELQRLSR